MQVDDETRDTIKTIKYPPTTTEMWSILGLCNVYGRVVPSFTGKTAPLKKMLKNGALTKFDLEDGAHVAVEERKKNLTEPQILALRKTNQPYQIETDAFHKQVGWVRLKSQNEEQDLRPVGHLSRSLKDAEWQYNTTKMSVWEWYGPYHCLDIIWREVILPSAKTITPWNGY